MSTPTPEQSRRYRVKNPEKVKAWKRAYYARHRARIRAKQNAYAMANRAIINARTRLYYARNHAVACAVQRLYRLTHPELRNEIAHRRRARMLNALTEKIDRARLIVRDRDICHICGKKIRRPKERSVDHLIPIVHGGDHTEINVALAHRRCNSRRGAGRIAAQLRLFG